MSIKTNYLNLQRTQKNVIWIYSIIFFSLILANVADILRFIDEAAISPIYINLFSMVIFYSGCIWAIVNTILILRNKSIEKTPKLIWVIIGSLPALYFLLYFFPGKLMMFL